MQSKLLFFIASVGLLFSSATFAEPVRVESAAGITAELDGSSGRYEIVSPEFDWKFSGELGRPVADPGLSLIHI